MNKNLSIHLLVLIAILIFAVFVRLPTFKLPHDNGDQLYYLGLAMKLDEIGFSEYTLRNIDLKGNDSLMGLFLAPEQKGSLLKNLDSAGVHYYDEPLFHRSYGFPYALMFSHRIFAKGQPYLTLRTTYRDKNGGVHSKDVNKTWFIQFYAAVIPFAFSLLFILATYFLARMFFSKKVALISAFLISISPIEILCSQKVWADTMVSFFVILAVLLFFLAKQKNNLWLSCIAGISCGIAVLVKPTGGFIVITLLIFHLWQHKFDIFKINKIGKVVFDKHLMVFGLTTLVIIFHWFYVITKTYGHPLYIPTKAEINQQGQWFAMLSQRPYFLYLVAIPYLVPVFSLAYFAVLVGPFIRGFMNEQKVFIIIWLLTFSYILMGGKENRYMLPAYPAMAMLSADLLVRIEGFFNRRFQRPCGLILIIAVLVACAFWSVPIGIEHALTNRALILKPF